MEKKSKETQGQLEKTPVLTQGISQTVSPKGVSASCGSIFPLGYV